LESVAAWPVRAWARSESPMATMMGIAGFMVLILSVRQSHPGQND
jgi:hypothetical protein